jgi:hypothetical protein
MADKNWKQNPEIMAARDYAKKFNRKAVIIFSFDGHCFWMHSYGENGEICKKAGRLGSNIYDLLNSGRIDMYELTESLRK